MVQEDTTTSEGDHKALVPLPTSLDPSGYTIDRRVGHLRRLLHDRERELLWDRAVQHEVMALRGYWSIEGVDQDAEQWSVLPFSGGQRRVGLVIPVWGLDGTVTGVQLRPTTPRLNDKLKPVKYENPRGAEAKRLDVSPPVLPYVLDDRYPLFVTEGVPKGDALASHGVPVVVVFGVTLWKTADWQRVPLRGRDVFICFDSDAVTNRDVRVQERRLAEYLVKRGARAWIVRLPEHPDGETKLGVDDWLALWPEERRFSPDRYRDLLNLGDQFTGRERDEVGLEFFDICDVLADRQPIEWLVRGWWTLDGAGIVGGAEKALKTWFFVLFAVAVASGKPFLGNEEWAVPEQRRVLFLTGEGGRDLIADRVEHVCEFYGVRTEQLRGWLRVSDSVAHTSSEAFRLDLTDELEDFDPAAVLIDPAYVYLAAGDGASNVFTMGQLLAELEELCRNGARRAVVVAHHFRKAVGSEPTLADLTQAGFRERAGTWALLWHREDPDLERQSFRLGVISGARRGFGQRVGLDVDLTPLDPDTLRHVGKLQVDVTAADVAGAEDGQARHRDDLWAWLREEPFERTQTELVGTGEGRNARSRALAQLRERGLVTSRSVRREGHRRELTVWGPLYDLSLADATARLLDL